MKHTWTDVRRIQRGTKTVTERTWTEAEFAELAAKADKSAFPAGVKFVFKKKGSR